MTSAAMTHTTPADTPPPSRPPGPAPARPPRRRRATPLLRVSVPWVRHAPGTRAPGPYAAGPRSPDLRAAEPRATGRPRSSVRHAEGHPNESDPHLHEPCLTAAPPQTSLDIPQLLPRTRLPNPPTAQLPHSRQPSDERPQPQGQHSPGNQPRYRPPPVGVVARRHGGRSRAGLLRGLGLGRGGGSPPPSPRAPDRSPRRPRRTIRPARRASSTARAPRPVARPCASSRSWTSGTLAAVCIQTSLVRGVPDRRGPPARARRHGPSR